LKWAKTHLLFTFNLFFCISFCSWGGVEIVGSLPNLACSARGVIPVLICTQDAHQSWEGPHIWGRWRLNFEGAAPGKDDGVVTQSIGEREKND